MFVSYFISIIVGFVYDGFVSVVFALGDYMYILSSGTCLYTHKKEKKIFLIYNEIQKGLDAKSYTV
jgi:hypothetical protein